DQSPSSGRLRKVRPSISQGLVVGDPMQREQRLDPLHVADALLGQASELAVGAASVLLLDTRHPHESARLTVPAAPGLQGAQQTLGVHAIRLHAPRPPVNLEACRIHDPAPKPRLRQSTLQPEPVVAGLKHALNPNRPPAPRHCRMSGRSISPIRPAASPPATRCLEILSVLGSWIAISHLALLSSMAKVPLSVPSLLTLSA